jgi:CxxC motif-containing protein
MSEEARELEKIICLGCPLGCIVKLTLDHENNVINVAGNKCKEGEKFAVNELRNPVRVLTATVLTQQSIQPLLPVKTDKPIDKKLLRQSMLLLAKVRTKPPIRMGDVIVSNLLNTKANIVATRDLQIEHEEKR